MEVIRAECDLSVSQERILKGPGKGKEKEKDRDILLRLEGEVLNDGRWTIKGSEGLEGKEPPDEESKDEANLITKDGVTWVREKQIVVRDPRRSDAPKKSSYRSSKHQFIPVKYEVSLWLYCPSAPGQSCPPCLVIITDLFTLSSSVRREFYWTATTHRCSHSQHIASNAQRTHKAVLQLSWNDHVL